MIVVTDRLSSVLPPDGDISFRSSIALIKELLDTLVSGNSVYDLYGDHKYELIETEQNGSIHTSLRITNMFATYGIGDSITIKEESADFFNYLQKIVMEGYAIIKKGQ